MTGARSLFLVFAATLVATQIPAAAVAAIPAGTGDKAGAPAVFPQQRSIEGYTLTINAPQVRSWPEFERFTSTIAFSLTPAGQTALH